MARGTIHNDEQKAVFYGIWRKAASTPGGVRIPCANEKAAILMRFSLYNATRTARAGKIEVDQELLDALAKCSASISEDDRTVVHVRPKLESAMMQILIAALGEETPLMKHSAEEKMLQEAQKRLVEKFGDGGAGGAEEKTPERPQNPYYKR